MATFNRGTTPIIVRPGERVIISANANASGLIAIPGEPVSQSIAGSTTYSYGGFSESKEVVITITSGRVEVSIIQDGSHPVGSEMIRLSSAYTIQSSDEGKRFFCSTALTVTVSSTSGDVIIFPPASGNLTIARSGVTLNGGTSSLTRSMSNNRAGVAVIANPVVSNDFTVTGS